MRRRMRHTSPCQPRALSSVSSSGFVLRDCDHLCPLDRAQRLAQIAGREQPVVNVAAAEEENVEIAVKLAMLKAIVEQVDAGELFPQGLKPLPFQSICGTTEVVPFQISAAIAFLCEGSAQT